MGSLAELVYLPRPREIRPAAGFFRALSGARIALLGDARALLPSAVRVQKIARDKLGMEWQIGAGKWAGGDAPAVSIADRARRSGRTLPIEDLRCRH